GEGADDGRGKKDFAHDYFALSVFVPAKPMLAGVVKVLLCIDFDVAARGIDVGEGLTAFDHFLEEEDQIGFFEDGGFPPRAAGKFAAAAVIMVAQTGGAGGRKLGDADVFAVRFVLENLAVDARY